MYLHINGETELDYSIVENMLLQTGIPRNFERRSRPTDL